MNRWAALALIVACLTLSPVLSRAAEKAFVEPFVAELEKTDFYENRATFGSNLSDFAQYVREALGIETE